ncbi:MAG: putative transcriptional regulator [Parcubacteria group bacterium GW2011_GWA1_44_13]|nr:MAG: putative transcriptional regulator [Parcubacteria group bacterium GW2011_GWA1_44_13]
MDTLGKLFGSQARVKILRLFLLNPQDAYDVPMVAEKSKTPLGEARRELTLLKAAGVITNKSFTKEIPSKKKNAKPTKKRVQGFQLKTTFPLLSSLKGLIVSETPLNRDEIVRRFKDVGKIKFLAISGIFIDEPEARVDVLIVGDDLKKRSIENVLRTIEAEIGHELSYGALETSEFLYRVSVYDKFVRDVLDGRHDTVIDKIGAEEVKPVLG